MKKQHITIHHDAGHAWASVTRRELIDLKIERLISPHSYQCGSHIYLEEDCDLAVYLHAKGHNLRHLSESLDWVEVHDGDNSPIRNMTPFAPKSAEPATRAERLEHQRVINLAARATVTA